MRARQSYWISLLVAVARWFLCALLAVVIVGAAMLIGFILANWQ